ncbi:MAG: galactose oxidase-like domain-containing protein [Terriglobales bacterium]
MPQTRHVRLYPWLILILLLLPSVPSARGQAQTLGQWSTLPYTMPINPIHAALLHTGKVLIVSGSGNYTPNTNYTAALWNPQAGTITVQTVAWDMFCNGMVILPDGRPFVLGGTQAYDPFFGLTTTATYDPATGLFTNQQNMAHGRWYPTGTVLGDGRVMVYSGAESGEDSPDQSLIGVTDTTVEIYTVGSGWSQEYPGSWTPPLYPRMHLLPNGTVFYSAPGPASAIFDPSSHTWAVGVANTNYGGYRGYGTSVLLPLTPSNNYDPRVMILGGGNPATNTTEIIDLGASSPAWQYSANMSQARTEMNAVLLPTGKVLALGGSVNDEEAASASLNADLFDPISQHFSSAGAEAYARLYHSVALLLPDATVWVAGSNPTRGTYQNHMEIYQPAYLFTTNGSGQTVLATRPSITSSPSTIDYASPFQVQTPDAAHISSVVMIRNAAVTHAFDMDQRMVGLSFTAGSGTLSVTGPPSGNIAPPGYYMLFLVNDQGVPSVANMIQVPSGIPPPPPPPPPTLGYVQGKSSTQYSGSSVAISYGVAQTAGDLNVVSVMWGDTISAVSSVTDSRGNSYALAAGPTTATGLTSVIYYAKNIAAGSNTVTVTFNRTAAYPNVNVLEYSGLDTVNPLDVTATATGSGTTANSGTATTGSASELIFGAGNPTSLFTGAGSGFSNRMINPYGGIAEDRIVNSTGSYNATAALQSGTWTMQMVTFRASP